MQVDEMAYESGAATSQPTLLSEHVIHEISISSHLEAGLVLCCCLVALVAFVQNRLPGSGLVSTGFGLVLMKYAIGYFMYPKIEVPFGFVTANMAVGPFGLALVAVGLQRQYWACGQSRKTAQGSAQ